MMNISTVFLGEVSKPAKSPNDDNISKSKNKSFADTINSIREKRNSKEATKVEHKDKSIVKQTAPESKVEPTELDQSDETTIEDIIDTIHYMTSVMGVPTEAVKEFVILQLQDDIVHGEMLVEAIIGYKFEDNSAFEHLTKEQSSAISDILGQVSQELKTKVIKESEGREPYQDNSKENTVHERTSLFSKVNHISKGIDNHNLDKHFDNTPVIEVKKEEIINNSYDKASDDTTLVEISEESGVNDIIIKEEDLEVTQQEKPEFEVKDVIYSSSADKSGDRAETTEVERTFGYKNSNPTTDGDNVFNQVVKGVKFSFKQFNPEVTLQLKPENLGKVTVKISVERGLIEAKFIAESIQVKEILESSFQNLKDSLSKQGLAIQNISVGVGNGGEGSRQFNKRQGFGNPKHKIKHLSGEFDINNIASKNNPYINNNSIDYLA